LTGEKIISYRAPYFSITQKSLWALDILKEEGIKNDSSIFPVINYRYGIPKNNRLPYIMNNGLWEWPITTYKTLFGNIPFAGGVYFRFIPYKIIQLLISNLIKHEPVLLYFHPWEMDPYQPRIKNISTFLRIRHYIGLKKNLKNISSLLNEFSTISLNAGICLLKE